LLPSVMFLTNNGPGANAPEAVTPTTSAMKVKMSTTNTGRQTQ